MATMEEQRRAEIERIMRNYDKKGRPVRYYSFKIGTALFKYAIGYPIWGVLWVLTMFCFTGRPPFSYGWCGTGRLQAEQRKRITTRVRANLPRPLYRHTKSKERYAVDEAALNGRRRLSLGEYDQEKPKKLKGLLSRAKQAVLLRRGGTKPPRERNRLLELPAEIRVRIWQFALGNRTIHIFYGEPVKRQPFVFPLKTSLFPLRIKHVKKSKRMIRRLSFVECVHRADPNGWENRHPLHSGCPDCGVLWNSFSECTGKVQWADTPDAGWTTSDKMVSIVAVEREWKPLALLSTCRQIYNEAIDLLYSDNTFHFPLSYENSHFSFSYMHSKSIRDFSNTILVQRLNRITRVSTTTFINSPKFGNLSDALAQHLPGLRYLELQALMAEDHVWRHIGPDMAALPKLVREMRNRVTGARVILRADLDSRVLPVLNFELPDGLEVITVPEEVWERRAMIVDRFRSVDRGNIGLV
ncbi:hypothetical protein F4678DRAFT_201264 [Xylaria arbuscula]|nr:hypothetical protein F4678DRAFT_201264 [Xylaria arbuscula]